MHRKIVLSVVVVLYYALVTFGLYRFDAGMLMTALWLYGLPAWLMARASHAPSVVILSVAALGAGLALLFEAIASLYGLWYTVGSDATRLFGLVPIEVLIASSVQALFFVLLYEALFDDGTYTVRAARERIVFMLVFLAGAIALVALHAFLFQGVFLTYSYLWIVGSIVAACFTMLALHKNPSVHFFDRVLDFAFVAALPALLGVWLAVQNVQRVYGYPDAYIGTVNVFGATIPIEELLLSLAVPLLVATIYELYLDDRY